MKSKVNNVDLLKIIYDELLSDEVYVEDMNKTVNLFNTNYKKDVDMKIYYEKPVGGNPYYVKNDELKKCAGLIQRLAFLELKAIGSEQMKTIINILYERIINNNKKIAFENKILKLESVFLKNKLDCLFNCITKNDIYILGFRGGNRNSLSYECELDIRVKAYKDIDVNDIVNMFNIITKEYEAKLEIEGGE